MFNFLKIRTDIYLKRNKALRSSVPYNSATQIGMIFTVEDKQKHEMIKDLIRKLERDGKKTKVICFLPADKQNYEFKFDFVTEKDFSFWGHTTSETATQFSATAFDYLFYIDIEPNPLILNLLAQSQAKCRVGEFWEGGQPFLEFMLKSANTRELAEGIYKYTSLLR